MRQRRGWCLSWFLMTGVLCIGCWLVRPAWAAADTRVALVIGNAAYAGAPLLNPVKDASVVAEALQAQGFQVEQLRDASKAQMEAALARLRDALQGRNGVGLLYYAGHGLQLDWHNYLLPVDAQIRTAADVAGQAINLQQVLDAFRAAGSRMNIVVLDACRDNPFGASASGKGLAPIDAPPGTFLAYATAPGNVAYDGNAADGHGLYTRFLAEQLRQPDARIEDVFKRVRYAVRQQSQGRQIPWESTSLEEDFSFDRGIVALQRLSGSARDEAFTAEKAAWDRIKGSRNVEDHYDFLKRHPNGLLSELAQARVAELQKAALVPQPPRGERPHDWLSRFREGDRYEFLFTDGLTQLERGRGTATIHVSADGRETVAEGTGMLRTTRSLSTGFITHDALGSYDPPWPIVPASEFQIGKKFSVRSLRTAPDGSRQWIDVDTRIVARERIQVALGEFDAYRIEVRMFEQSGLIRSLTFWFDPEWGYPLRTIYDVRGRSGPPDILVRETVFRSRAGEPAAR